MDIFEKLMSKNAIKIWEASGAIAQSYDIAELKKLSAHLPQLKSATKGIDLGGALCPNSYHLEFAFKKLEHVKNNSGCLCALHPSNMFIDPLKELASKRITIDEEVDFEGVRLDYYLCHCNTCFTAFKVEVSEGHFTSWKWIVNSAV